MSNDYYWADTSYYPDLMYSFAGYPNDECELHLVNITFCSPEFHILGITAGVSMPEAHDTLIQFGFTVINKDQDDMSEECFDNSGIIITLTGEGSLVKMASIEIPTEYLGNRIY